MRGLDSILLHHSGGRTIPAPIWRGQGLPIHAVALTIATALRAASPSARALTRYGGGRIETSGVASISLSGAHTIAGPVAVVASTNLSSQARLDINAPLTLSPGSSLSLYGASQAQIAGADRVDLVGTGGSSVITVSPGAVLDNAGVIAIGENTVLDVRGRIDGVDGSPTNRSGSMLVRAGAALRRTAIRRTARNWHPPNSWSTARLMPTARAWCCCACLRCGQPFSPRYRRPP